MEDTLVPIFGIIFLFGGPIAAIIVWRLLAHQERMEMLRRGIAPMDPRTMRKWMKYGWQPGQPMPPGAPGPMPGAPGPMPGAPGSMPPPMQNAWWGPDFYAQQQLRKGMQVAFVGLALLIGLSFIGYHGDGPPHYGPWLLGGLIPLFVGIAQVITAIMGGARIGGFSQQPGIGAQPWGPGPGSGPQPTPGPAGPSAQAPSGPYAWRPGQTPEIEKPAGPPDFR